LDADEERFDAFLIPTAAFLTTALVMGGSSFDLSPALWLDLAALPLLLISVVRLAARRTRWSVVWLLVVMGGAIAVALAQLAPLPPEVWGRMGGRDLIADVYRAAGVIPPARPLSLDPDLTWRTLAGFAPPLALFCAAATLRDGARRVLAGLVVLVGLGSVVMAMTQKASGAEQITGIFANRNHQGTLLACCIPLAAMCCIRPWASPGGSGAKRTTTST